MQISIGADHAGFEMKQMLIEFMAQLGHTVHDVGAFKPEPGDDIPIMRRWSPTISGKARRNAAFSSAAAGLAYR